MGVTGRSPGNTRGAVAVDGKGAACQLPARVGVGLGVGVAVACTTGALERTACVTAMGAGAG
jgi:hypothetical protein